MTVNISRKGVSEILKGLELNFQGDLLGYRSTRGWLKIFRGGHCTGSLLLRGVKLPFNRYLCGLRKIRKCLLR